jgi:hypothetical protein
MAVEGPHRFIATVQRENMGEDMMVVPRSFDGCQLLMPRIEHSNRKSRHIRRTLLVSSSQGVLRGRSFCVSIDQKVGFCFRNVNVRQLLVLLSGSEYVFLSCFIFSFLCAFLLLSPSVVDCGLCSQVGSS